MKDRKTLIVSASTYHGKMRKGMPMTEQMKVSILQSSTMAASAEYSAIPTAKNMLKRIPQKLRHSTPTSSWERTKPATMINEQQTPPRNLQSRILSML